MKLMWVGVSTAPVALRNQWDACYAALIEHQSEQ